MKVACRDIMHLLRMQVVRVAVGHTPAESVEARQRADRVPRVEREFQSLTTTLAAAVEGRAPWVEMHRPVLPETVGTVLHIQSRDHPRRTRGAAVEACVQFLVCILQVEVVRAVRVEAVQGPALETGSLRRTMAAVAALEAVLVATPGLAETDTKASSSFVYRLPKFLSVK